MPRYQPTGPTLSQETDAAFDAEWQAELRLTESRERFEAIKRREKVRLSEISPYGARSPHSWFLDRVAVARVGGDAHASERLNRHRAWAEKQTRAVSTSTLSFVSGVVLPPWVAEAVSFGVRSAPRSPTPSSESTSRPKATARAGRRRRPERPSRPDRSRRRTPPSPRAPTR
jgi:hypothetical protein